MGDKKLSTEIKDLKKKLVALKRTHLKEANKEHSLREKTSQAERMYNRAIAHSKIKKTKYAEEYKEDLIKRREVYYNLQQKLMEQIDISSKSKNEYEEQKKICEDLEYRYNNRNQIAYANKCGKIVKECIEVKEYTKEIKPTLEEHVFKTMPATYDKTVVTPTGETTKQTYYDYNICWFLDSVWRINHQVHHWREQFDWKLCTGIYYNHGSLYIKIKRPIGEYPAQTIISAAEANTCINLDIDWDMIAEADSVPVKSIVLFDVEKDKTPRIKLSEKWLKKTPAHKSYQAFLAQETDRVKRMLRNKKRKSHASHGA